MDTAFKRTSAASAADAASSTTSAAKGNIIEPILIVGLSPPSENNNTITGIVSSQQMSSICISSGSSLDEFSNSDSSSSSDEVLVDEMPSKDLLPAGTRTRTRTLSNSKGEDDVITTETGRKVYTKGRPPWYDRDGKRQKKSYLIGICGGSASGKTTVAKKIISRLEMPWVTVLSMDSFYKVLNEEQHLLAAKHEYNFDHPDAFDFDLMYESLLRLKDGKSVEVPVYDFTTHRRAKNPKLMYGADILIFEGILSFHKPEIADLMDMKVFVDTDSDTRLVRRLERDIAERGRDVAGVLEQYIKYVKPAFDSFIAPAMKIADIIVPRGGENVVAIDLIVRQIKNQLTERGYYASAANGISNNSHPQQQLAAATIDSSSGPCPRMWPPSLHILRECAQVRGLHASILSRKTTRAEFMGFCERLMPKLIEQAVKFMPMPTHRQQQNGGHPKGDALKGICGVSIMRAGESLENSLRSVIKNCKLGKILIVSNERTLEPELYYLRLPKNISQYKILLMDATVATGASAIMAIRILLDHDVREEDIVLLSLLMAEAGVHSLAYAFPRVTLLTTAVQSKINEHLNANWKAENFEEFLAFGNEAVELATDDEDNAGDNDEIVTATVDGQK